MSAIYPPLNSKISFKYLIHSSIVLFLIFVFIIPGCQNSLTPEEVTPSISPDISKINIEQLNIDRNLIARTIAVLLKDEEYKKILEEEKNNANNREEILDASVFLNKVFEVKSSNIKFITKMAENVLKEDKNFETRISQLQKGLIDIYFPIDEHRENWKSNSNELLVAVYDREKIDKGKGYLDAYDLNGKLTLIDVSKIPVTPTLVIAFSETHGNYPMKESINGFFNSLQKNSGTVSDPESGGECYFRIGTWFCREAVGDGFWDDPEYYSSVRHPSPTSSPTRTNFYEVVDGGTGYYNLNRTVFTYPYSEPYLFNPSNVTHIELWEDDGGLAGGDDPIEVNWRNTDGLGGGWNNIQFYNGYNQWWGDAQDQWVTMGWFY